MKEVFAIFGVIISLALVCAAIILKDPKEREEKR
jgi:hypothetical protein